MNGAVVLRLPGSLRSYRLYVPPAPSRPAPLLVALHGCRQTPEDFALGTRFDDLCDRYGALAVYPQQPVWANPGRCWNWFLASNQRRERGEPADILAIVDAVRGRYAVDPESIFVVGLSAGAAMAAILAEQAPDVFAGVGLMAGVALHASHDVASASSAMRGLHEQPAFNFAEMEMGRPGASAGYGRLRVSIWTGERDDIVDPANAELLARQFRALLGLGEAERRDVELADGRVTTWSDASDRVRIQLRCVEDLGHAWSGGSFRGSHTAPAAPRVSEALFAFFLGEPGARA